MLDINQKRRSLNNVSHLSHLSTVVQNIWDIHTGPLAYSLARVLACFASAPYCVCGLTDWPIFNVVVCYFQIPCMVGFMRRFNLGKMSLYMWNWLSIKQCLFHTRCVTCIQTRINQHLSMAIVDGFKVFVDSNLSVIHFSKTHKLSEEGRNVTKIPSIAAWASHHVRLIGVAYPTRFGGRNICVTVNRSKS